MVVRGDLARSGLLGAWGSDAKFVVLVLGFGTWGLGFGARVLASPFRGGRLSARQRNAWVNVARVGVARTFDSV